MQGHFLSRRILQRYSGMRSKGWASDEWGKSPRFPQASQYREVSTNRLRSSALRLTSNGGSQTAPHFHFLMSPPALRSQQAYSEYNPRFISHCFPLVSSACPSHLLSSPSYLAFQGLGPHSGRWRGSLLLPQLHCGTILC